MAGDNALCAAVNKLQLMFATPKAMSMRHVVHQGSTSIATRREHRAGGHGLLILTVECGLIDRRHG